MKNLFLFTGIIFIVILGVFIYRDISRRMVDIRGFEVRKEDSSMVLFKRSSQQGLLRTGLTVPIAFAGTYEVPVNIVVSPDKQFAVFNEWQDVLNEIYIANIDGSNKKKIAEQEVPEGSGELLAETLQWSSDGAYIMYEETGIQIYGAGVLPDDELGARRIRITYRVDISTMKKEKISEREEY